MNYFIGSLYGNYEGYEHIKKTLKLKPRDHLWILGDIIDGNDEEPNKVFDMILDIRDQKNIHLILGDHEFAHIMRYASTTNKEVFEAWTDFLTGMNVSGDAVMDYIDHFPDEAAPVFDYLMNDCDISEILRIGSNYFYLTHGFPKLYRNYLTEWQLNVTTGNISEKPFINCIMSDPTLQDKKIDLSKMSRDNTFVVCAHQNIQTIKKNISTIYHNKGIFLLGEDKPYEQIPVLGIDSAGYFLQNILYI